jgi:hypothetical protein
MATERDPLADLMENWSPNRRKVFQAIFELCEAGKQASRRTICEASGLSMQIVDDHCRNLKTGGFIRLINNGMFAPVEQSADRPISGTILPSGRYKLEIGDQVMDLSLREARLVALLTGGVGMQFGL